MAFAACEAITSGDSRWGRFQVPRTQGGALRPDGRRARNAPTALYPSCRRSEHAGCIAHPPRTQAPCTRDAFSPHYRQEVVGPVAKSHVPSPHPAPAPAPRARFRLVRARPPSFLAHLPSLRPGPRSPAPPLSSPTPRVCFRFRPSLALSTTSSRPSPPPFAPALAPSLTVSFTCAGVLTPALTPRSRSPPSSPFPHSCPTLALACASLQLLLSPSSFLILPPPAPPNRRRETSGALF